MHNDGRHRMYRFHRAGLKRKPFLSVKTSFFMFFFKKSEYEIATTRVARPAPFLLIDVILLTTQGLQVLPSYRSYWWFYPMKTVLREKADNFWSKKHRSDPSPWIDAARRDLSLDTIGKALPIKPVTLDGKQWKRGTFPRITRANNMEA